MSTPPAEPRLTVAVINTSEEVVTLLSAALELEGYTAATSYVINYRTSLEDVLAFLATHAPAAIVWDVAIPYEENWAFLQSVRSSAVVQGRPFVVTTTNQRALESLVGTTEAFEIIGKP